VSFRLTLEMRAFGPVSTQLNKKNNYGDSGISKSACAARQEALWLVPTSSPCSTTGTTAPLRMHGVWTRLPHLGWLRLAHLVSGIIRITIDFIKIIRVNYAYLYLIKLAIPIKLLIHYTKGTIYICVCSFFYFGTFHPNNGSYFIFPSQYFYTIDE
jgi:hypothetical protein